ncbi:MAG: hypothetical protein ACXIU8_15285 [Alkalilacustris sp.]
MPPLYLARASYRRRRAMDAARLLPFIGIFLFVLPRLWGDAGADPGAADPGAAAAREGVYLFVVWGGLVVAAAALSRILRTRAEEDGAEGRTEGRTEGGAPEPAPQIPGAPAAEPGSGR